MRSRLPQMVMADLPGYARSLDRPIASVRPYAHRGSIRRAKPQLKKMRLEGRLARLQDTLVAGNSLYKAVQLVERNWRNEVMQGESLYDPEDEKTIIGYYRQWMEPCERCVQEINDLVARGLSVRGAGEFLNFCAEAKAIMAADNPFFDNAENAARWYKAVTPSGPQPRQVRVDEHGRIFEMSGERFEMPGLSPDDILEAAEDVAAGRVRPLREIVASWD
jgi:hypothetical protein